MHSLLVVKQGKGLVLPQAKLDDQMCPGKLHLENQKADFMHKLIKEFLGLPGSRVFQQCCHYFGFFHQAI